MSPFGVAFFCQFHFFNTVASCPPFPHHIVLIFCSTLWVQLDCYHNGLVCAFPMFWWFEVIWTAWCLPWFFILAAVPFQPVHHMNSLVDNMTGMSRAELDGDVCIMVCLVLFGLHAECVCYCWLCVCGCWWTSCSSHISVLLHLFLFLTWSRKTRLSAV